MLIEVTTRVRLCVGDPLPVVWVAYPIPETIIRETKSTERVAANLGIVKEYKLPRLLHVVHRLGP